MREPVIVSERNGISVILPQVNIITPLTKERCKEIMDTIEFAGRTCYQSEPKGDPVKFIQNLIERGHESVLEHCTVTIEFVTDRATTLEMVRHRVAAYSQESTRYVKYDEGVYIHPIEFIGAYDRYTIWMDECIHSHEKYNELRDKGCQKQEARSVLNNSLKTTIVVTYNMREWRHVLKLRCAKAAHPHIKEIMIPILHYFRFKFPGMFDDIEYDEEFYKKYMSRLNTLLKETFITDTPIKKVPAESPKPEKKCDACTKDKCDCHTESNESDEENDKLVLTEGECTFKELDPRIKEIMKFHGKPMVVEETYITQLKMKGTYKYTATNSIIVRELTGCSTSFRLQTFNYMDTDGREVLPYSEVRDTVYLTAKITVLLGTPITGVCQMALKRFEQILIEHDRKDLIPYLSKISFKSEDIC